MNLPGAEVVRPVRGREGRAQAAQRAEGVLVNMATRKAHSARRNSGSTTPGLCPLPPRRQSRRLSPANLLLALVNTKWLYVATVQHSTVCTRQKSMCTCRMSCTAAALTVKRPNVFIRSPRSAHFSRTERRHLHVMCVLLLLLWVLAIALALLL